MKHRQQQSHRRYPRTARVNELLREIIGEALERLDDDRLEMVTVTAVDCEADIRRAVVYVDSLSDPEDDGALLEALGEVRHRLQAAIGSQARLKRTPELVFAIDPVVRSAGRIEDVLRGIPEVAEPAPESADPPAEVEVEVDTEVDDEADADGGDG